MDPLPFEDWGSYLRRLGFTHEQLSYVKRSYANACGESMRFLSARARLEQLRDKGRESGLGDYRLMSGYDSLTGQLADKLDLHLGEPHRQNYLAAGASPGGNAGR